jgi:hypothetical protein
MSDYGLRYAVLINPRYYGWDNSYISYSLQKYPDRFVAHGLDQPGRSESGGAAALLDKRAWLSGHALQPLVPSELEVAQFEKRTIRCGRKRKDWARCSISTSCRIRCRCSKIWRDGSRASKSSWITLSRFHIATPHEVLAEYTIAHHPTAENGLVEVKEPVGLKRRPRPASWAAESLVENSTTPRTPAVAG